MNEPVSSDIAILDLLRKRDRMTVSEIADVTEVTATAVRQRLNRLLAQGLIDRVAIRSGRGRPSHQYILTKQGRKKTGANFADLAIALWQEIREIEDPEVRRGLIQRISKRLARQYEAQVSGDTVEEKMTVLAELFSSRRMPFEVEASGDLPVLTALGCPYPELAEQDRSICAMERLLFSELLGEPVKLSQCRLDGDTCCTFEMRAEGTG